MIRTCLFDMGNVLVHFSHELMCEQIGRLCDRSGPVIRRLLFDTGMQLDFERGRWTEHEFHTQFERTLGGKVDFEALRIAGSDIFSLNEPMPELLDRLRSRGIRLVLLSNTSVTHIRWVREKFDVLDPFDDVVLSYEVGAVKPEPAIYEDALTRIECRPAECFYADDVAENIAAAREFGLQAEVFTNADALQRQLATHGLAL